MVLAFAHTLHMDIRKLNYIYIHRVRCPMETHFSKLYFCVAYSSVIFAYFYMFYICIDVKKPVPLDSSIRIRLSFNSF